MARKDNLVEDEYEIPKEEVVEETAPSKPLFKKPISQQQDAQTIVVTENQLILELLKNLNAKIDEILVIAKQ